MGFDRETCGLDVVEGELYSSAELRELFAKLGVEIDPEWESDDYEEGEVPKLVFWTNERLPDGRTVFARCHYEEDVHLVGKVVRVEGAKLEIKGLEKLTHTDHLYVYDMCYPYGEQGHLTVKEVMEMPAMKKNTYTFYEHEEGEFEDENVEDVVVLKKKPAYKKKCYEYEYVKMGVTAIAFLKEAVKDMEGCYYLVPTGDCICCS